MKSFILYIGGGVILAVFAWWLNQERYDVKYTLSERIPLSFESPQQESVQQLEVKNLSGKAVEGVQIKLPPRITKYELIKNSQADKAEIFTKQNNFELLYGALPAAGTFRLVLKTAGEGILKSEVQVRHSRGIAEEALSDASPFRSTSFWAGTGILFAYICVILFGMRSFKVDSWNTNAEYRSEAVLKAASRPFYIFADRWKDIREKAISHFGKLPDYGAISESEITSSPIYKYLNGEKPESFSDDEWKVFCQTKATQFLTTFYRRMSESWARADEFLKILRIRKPAQFPPDKWDDLREKVQEQFCKRKLDDPFDSNIIDNVQEIKPDEIDSKHWVEYRKKLTVRHFKDLSTEMEYQDSPIDFLDRQNLAGLPHDDVQTLRTRAYKLQLAALPDLFDEKKAKQFIEDEKPAWMTGDDYLRKKAIAERTLKMVEEAKINAIVQSNLTRILAGSPMDDKSLDRLDSETRQELKELDDKIRISTEKNISESNRISEESLQVAELKTKVVKQLAVLEKLFIDPSSIDRIEPYENPFTIGNLELLKKISISLRE